MLAAALATSCLRVPPDWDDTVFLGCWVGVVAAAAAVHLPRGVGPRWAVPLSLNAGVWTGAVIAAAGMRSDLLKSLPLALLAYPGAWLVARKGSIIIKVMASWLIAVSVLALSLQWAPTTPGYKPDHMD